VRFKEGIELKNRVENANDADENNKAPGKKVHDKDLGVFKTIRTDKHLDSEHEEENRKQPDNENSYPP
jgi:hypothetical protein